MSTSTLHKNLVRDDVVVVGKKDFEKITQENRELRLALRAIVASEAALRQGKTRSLVSFLRSRPKRYAKNH